MTDRIRSSMRRLAVAATAIASACGSDSTAPRLQQTDAAAAAQTFAQLADSVTRSGGNSDVGGAYAGIAGLLRMGGRITPITLTIDGVSSSFLATAMSIETVTNACPPGAQCFAPEIRLVQRSLVAWDKDDPKRIVQLSSSSDDEKIATIRDSMLFASYAPSAALIYLDGKGGTFVGTSGDQRFAVTKSSTPCPADTIPLGVLRPRGYNATCVLADVSIKFDAKVEPSQFLGANSTVGVHTLAMAAQTVAGTHQESSYAWCDTTCIATPGGPNGPPPLPTPPVTVRPSTDLPASLTATVDSLVHLTFTVRNPSGAPMKITFPSGQRFDIVATDSTTGKDVWRWSANQGFVAMVQEETIPGNGALVYTASWKPLAKSRYLFHASLVSTSARAEAYAAVVVP